MSSRRGRTRRFTLPRHRRRADGFRRTLRFEALEPRRVLSTATGLEGLPIDPNAVEAAAMVPPQIENVQLTSDPQVQQQPRLAVNPLDPNHIAVDYNDETLVFGRGRFGVAVSVSRDGGASWQQSSVALPTGFDEIASLADVSFDDQGRLFISFQAGSDFGEEFSPIDVFQTGAGAFVARSDDGGLTWNEPLVVEAFAAEGGPHPFTIAQDLAIDTFETLPDGSPNPEYGNLYCWCVSWRPALRAPGSWRTGSRCNR